MSGTSRLFAMLILALSGMAACRSGEPARVERPLYVVTIPPFASIVEPLVGDRADVQTLLPPAASPHTHDLRPSDLRGVAGASAIFYGAEELDAWAADLQGPSQISMLDLVPDSMLLPLPAARAGAAPPAGTDPHFWSDPLAVEAMLPSLTSELCDIDADGCADYRRNAAGFADTLRALDRRVKARLQHASGQGVLLSQPFFQYFLLRYGIRLVGVIEPIPGREPSSRELQLTIERAAEANAILTQQQLPSRSGRVVSEATSLPLSELDPMGGSRDRETYVETVEYNARRVAEVLR